MSVSIEAPLFFSIEKETLIGVSTYNRFDCICAGAHLINNNVTKPYHFFFHSISIHITSNDDDDDNIQVRNLVCICRNIWSCRRNILLDTEMQVGYRICIHTFWFGGCVLLFFSRCTLYIPNRYTYKFILCNSAPLQGKRWGMSPERWNQFIAYFIYFFCLCFIVPLFFSVSMIAIATAVLQCEFIYWMNDIA